MISTDLGGHSGCKILLCEPDTGAAFVRKISSSIDYNERLENQKKKQKDFYSKAIKAPAVLTDGYTEDGLYFFDMQYIQGITLVEYIKNLEVSKIRGLVDDIIDNIVCIDDKGSADAAAFTSKIIGLKEKLQSLKNPVVDEALTLLERHDWSVFKKTSCHGDMTLENIIVKDDELYLIDFLDSFYDCWILDISTLMQDVQTLWSYRNEFQVNINTLIRLIIFRDILVERVKAAVGNEYLEVYYALLLKLIRIYPYTKDTLTYRFLNQKTESIISIIKENIIISTNVGV